MNPVWLDLSGRAVIYMTGEDRARLLHALTTNHVQQLKPGEYCYAFFLNAQGRILADVNILCLPDRLLLDLEPEVREKIYQHLDHYIIADDVTLEDATDSTAVIGVEGVTLEALGETGFPVAPISSTGAPGYRLFVPVERKAEIVAKLEAAGAVQLSPEAARAQRIANGKPRYGEEITETTLPQETRLDQALHFSKGCYLGQEIVERIRSRGHVNKLLMGVTVQADVAAGAKLTKDGQEAGQVASTAGQAGLAYLRPSFALSGTELDAGGVKVVVR